ncbi:MAG TPA: alpha/beta hydrolase [Chitinophagaceae bacterium]|nr:alpha/beta hydrolase [Chitinophagaceae bacterium]
MKKFFRWLLYGLGGVLLILLIAAQFGDEFRTSDKDAAATFAKAHVPFKTGYLHINNRTMHYVAAGQDSLPTIVFIHGSPGSWNAFEDYLLDADLLKKYRMVSLDRPGFGYSNYGDALDFAQQGILLSAVLDTIQNGKAMALVGHSLGGPMVIKLTAENPALPVKNIVVLAGSVDPAQEEPEKWRGIINKFPLRYFIPGAMRPSNDELKWFKKDVYTLAPDFAKVTCNVVLMHGDSDQLVPPPNALYSKAHLTNAKSDTLVWLKGENHFIPWTRFDAIKQQLLQLKDMQ